MTMFSRNNAHISLPVLFYSSVGVAEAEKSFQLRW